MGSSPWWSGGGGGGREGGRWDEGIDEGRDSTAATAVIVVGPTVVDPCVVDNAGINSLGTMGSWMGCRELSADFREFGSCLGSGILDIEEEAEEEDDEEEEEEE